VTMPAPPRADVVSRPPGDESTDLLLELGQALHAAALPADVVEERLRAVAEALGLDAQFFTLQSFFTTELRRGGIERIELRRIPFDTHWNLTQTAALTDLTADIAARKLDSRTARAELAGILAAKSPYPSWLVAPAWGVYGGAVAARVGGGWLEIGAAIIIGLVAGSIHFGSAGHKEINLEKSFLGGFLGSLAAFLLAFVLPPFDYPRALFGGISLLIPAMVITIGVHELANEALESGAVRMIYGFLCFALLGAGIVAAFSLAHVVGKAPPDVTATRLPELAVLACVAVGGLALVICLQARPRDVVWIVAAAVLAFGTQELTRVIFGGRGAPIIAAFILGSAAYLQARIPGHIPFTVLVPGLLQLAPGFLGTQATFKMVTFGSSANDASFFGVIVLAFQLGTGILASSMLFRKRHSRNPGVSPRPRAVAPKVLRTPG
jgi:uncharacterized membrane protein YjjP (DUF1212 family)/uncharacterized membrane protein YjjB (DUF3815 family)